jgi:hypothetical protein
LEDVIGGIIGWKKSSAGSPPSGYLINGKLLELAGSPSGDWYPIGLGRFGYDDNYDGYLAAVSDYVQKKYETKDKLDKNKAAEWHRISLAILAAGGNPRALNGIDLIADGTYNRVGADGAGILGRQGINGYIWGLIAIDAMRYEVPKDAAYTRADLITALLERQLDDGGFALTGEVSDPDITAMAAQALSPYYNSEIEYGYTAKNGGTVKKKVRAVIDECLETLSALQNENGGYSSWGTPNAESTAWVAAALCSLGIDFEKDERFVKNGNTVYDGILKYRLDNGAFCHSYSADGENTHAETGAENSMTSEQVLLGLVSQWRQKNGMRRLFDFRPERSAELKAQIAAAENAIAELTNGRGAEGVQAALHFDGRESAREGNGNGIGRTQAANGLYLGGRESELGGNGSGIGKIQAAYDLYLSIPESERAYVKNYKILSEYLAAAEIGYAPEDIESGGGGEDGGVVLSEFTQADIDRVNALPDVITTRYRAEVLTLLNKIKLSPDFENKRYYTAKLESAKDKIDAILAEIAAIDSEIESALYPFANVGLDDKKTVEKLLERCGALSEYDGNKVAGYEYLLKSKTRIDNLMLALWLSIGGGGAAAAGAGLLTARIYLRKKRAVLLRFMSESDE